MKTAKKPANELPKATSKHLSDRERREQMREDFNRRLESEKRSRKK